MSSRGSNRASTRQLLTPMPSARMSRPVGMEPPPLSLLLLVNERCHACHRWGGNPACCKSGMGVWFGKNWIKTYIVPESYKFLPKHEMCLYCSGAEDHTHGAVDLPLQRRAGRQAPDSVRGRRTPCSTNASRKSSCCFVTSWLRSCVSGPYGGGGTQASVGVGALWGE